MNTYLLTGGAGFIGSHLLEKLLKHKNRVFVIDNFNDFYDYKIKVRNIIDALYSVFSPDNYKGTEKEKIEEIFSNMEIIYSRMSSGFSQNIGKENLLKLFIQEAGNISQNFGIYFIDIRDKNSLDSIFSENKIDIVIHLAAMAGVRPSFEDPLLYEEVNIKGTLNILETMRKYNLKRFICASSSSVYGDNPKLPFSEKDVIKHTLSPYAYTKKSCEELGRLYWKHFGINTIMLRFFTVFGPRQRPDLAIHKFLDLMTSGKKIPFFGDGSSGRDYTYIEDIVSGIIKSTEYIKNSSNCYEIFNLGNSNVISLKEMVETLKDVSGNEPKLELMDFQPGDMPVTYADISKAQSLLGYAPETSFKEGIEKFNKWYKERNHNFQRIK